LILWNLKFFLKIGLPCVFHNTLFSTIIMQFSYISLKFLWLWINLLLAICQHEINFVEILNKSNLFHRYPEGCSGRSKAQWWVWKWSLQWWQNLERLQLHRAECSCSYSSLHRPLYQVAMMGIFLNYHFIVFCYFYDLFFNYNFFLNMQMRV
jgi:hypothetical protein